MFTTVDNLYNELLLNARDNIKKYSNNVIPGSKPVIGVRLPELRKIAKNIAKSDYRTFLKICPDDYLEYQILKAYTIGYLNDDIEQILLCADSFIPTIQDWAVNDAFCQNFKPARKYPERVWSWLNEYAAKDDEYSQRVAAVLSMSHFLTTDYIDSILRMMNELKYDGYYTRMGVAWCVATAYAKFPEKTLNFLKHNELDDWTYNKSIQKMLESFRVSDDDKIMLRSMKRRINKS